MKNKNIKLPLISYILEFALVVVIIMAGIAQNNKIKALEEKVKTQDQALSERITTVEELYGKQGKAIDKFLEDSKGLNTKIDEVLNSIKQKVAQ